MNVELEYLKHDDLQEYKCLLDGVLGESVDLDTMKAKYRERHPSTKTVVAKKGSEIIGTITFVLIDTFTRTGDPKIEFLNFAVAPVARGTETATMLMNFVIDYAQEYGYQSITVNCGVDAERAHYFYEKMGFERDDRARFVLVV